jgi:UDP-N-acetylmuramyl pentapeptide phosphotransferase/UDP-N-acetylglucosamine-1-phosphate transferase
MLRPSEFILIASAASAFVVCGAILLILLRTGWAWSLATDVPNSRSLHSRPTPRVGGWGIVPASLLAIWVYAPQLGWVACGAAVLAAVSQLDDRRGLSARVRFGAHWMIVGALVLCYPVVVPWWVMVVLSFLLVWLVNLYNFMDGSDGLAGGMAVLGFGAYALAAGRADSELAVGAASVSAAAAAFLLFNFHPAKIFLGDAGSISLGFLAGAFGYWGWRSSVWPIWFPAMIFAPFIADASMTLLNRVLRGEPFWKPHREHYYQRMVRSGLGHSTTALAWYVLMAVGIGFALLALTLSPVWQWIIVVCWIAVLICAGVIVDRRWMRFNLHKVPE